MKIKEIKDGDPINNIFLTKEKGLVSQRTAQIIYL